MMQEVPDKHITRFSKIAQISHLVAFSTSHVPRHAVDSILPAPVLPFRPMFNFPFKSKARCVFIYIGEPYDVDPESGPYLHNET
jgi:hypothetical protein